MKLVALLLVFVNGIVFAEEVVQTQTANTASNGLPGIQSTTTLQKAVPAATPKSWGASYLNETRYGRKEASNGDGEADLYHRIGITYKLAGGTLGVFQPWTQKQNMVKDTADVVTNDVFVRFVFNNVSMNHDWTLEPQIRYYIPTSQASQLLGTNGALRTDLEFKKPLNGKLTFSYYFLGQYAFQNSLSSLKVENDIRNSKIKGKIGVPSDRANYAFEANTRYVTYNLLGMYYEMNKKWTFLQQIGVQNTHTFADAAHAIKNQNEDKALVWSYFSYEINPKVNLSFGLEQERGSANRAAEPSFTLFADNETNYFASLSVGI